ncbi:MAG: ATP-binding cassette domain-containing protein [Opitutales bacterium]|nr:ATP-binding cassette domain-containing protein [Opitutales bacterium]
MSFVCPHCLSGLRNTADTCPQCGRVFNASDWIPEAYSSKYLRSWILFELPGGGYRKVARGIDTFFVGSNPGVSGIEIKNPACSEKHIRISRNGNIWEIYGNEGEFFVDGRKYVRGANVSIESGSKINIGTAVITVKISYALPKFQDDATEKTISSPVVLSGGDVSLGSAYDSSLVVAGADSLHAKIYRCRKDGKWYLVNCSRRGTFLNGSPVHNAELNKGDRIRVAETRFVFTNSALHPFVASGLQIRVENVSVRRNGREILRDVSMLAATGEFVGVLGPSGCGKSSLIQRLVGLDCFDSGLVKVNGRNFSEVKSEFLSRTSYLPQQIAVHADLTVREEMTIFCELHGEDLSQIGETLELVGLRDETQKRIGTLSGGQQRRLGIALELLRNPQLLVLDEPTSGLDPKTETDVMTYLRRVASQGKTVICSTHILENLNLFDKILVLADGRSVFFDSPKNLFHTFGIRRSSELYEKLGNSNSIEYFAKKVSSAKIPAVPGNFARLEEKETFWINETCGYLKRMLCEFLAFRHTPNKFLGFLQSTFFIQLIVQPILVALAIKVSCAYKMTTDSDYKDVLFFCAISVFWLGLNNTIRELVRERVPWRCLERMAQVSTTGYLLSKLLWNSFVCVLQIAIFALCIYGIASVPLKSGGSHVVSFTAGTFFILSATGFLGALIGLAISAFFKRENAAVSLLPIVLIPVLFFSQPIVRDDGNSPKLASAIVEIMPCHAPQVLMDKIDDAEQPDSGKQVVPVDWFRAARVPGLYALFALGVMIYFQNKREHEWNGR